MKMILATVALLSTAAPVQTALPAAIARQLTPGYEVIACAHLVAGRPMRSFELVALTPRMRAGFAGATFNAPARPLLDNDARIAVKGRYFTVQNGVACGQHWTDYITFRLDGDAGAFAFGNERREIWRLNSSNDIDAEALVRSEPTRVVRDRPGHATLFAAWRPHH